ncbi:ABC transporter permease subunit [Streptomyces sp. NPDC050546]|uniref:ABC transporter permease subunit n=1 Tax=Streptomyces sp. NPDC050546 TaxID=3365628 RepID=UPI0037A027F6
MVSLPDLTDSAPAASAGPPTASSGRIPDRGPDDDLRRIVPRRRVGRLLSAALALLLFAMVVNSVVRNRAFQWDVVGLYLGALYPTLGLGIPFGAQFVTVRWTEAAQALGIGRARTLRRIVVPQSMRSIVPIGRNMLVGTLKGTSIVSVLAVHGLLYSAQLIYNQTYQVIPLLMVATLWYITVTTVLSVGQFRVERHYARGAARALPPTPVQRLRARLAGYRRPLRSLHFL